MKMKSTTRKTTRTHSQQTPDSGNVTLCRCREAGELRAVKWSVFSISLAGKGWGAPPVLPFQHGLSGGRSERESVAAHGLIWAMVFQKKMICLVPARGTGMCQPTPIPTCPGHVSWEVVAWSRARRGKSIRARSSSTEPEHPSNSACNLFTNIPRGAQWQTAETKCGGKATGTLPVRSRH